MPGLRAPAIPQDEESIPKFNFQVLFDREPFTDQCQVLFKEANRKLVKYQGGHHVMKKVIRTEGRAKMNWLQKKNLLLSYSLINGLELFYKIKKKRTTLKVLLPYATDARIQTQKP
jgi:hypothetical protein